MFVVHEYHRPSVCSINATGNFFFSVHVNIENIMSLYLSFSLRPLPKQTKTIHVLFKPIFRQLSSKSGKPGGPASDKLKAIPFAQHIKAAEKVCADIYILFKRTDLTSIRLLRITMAKDFFPHVYQRHRHQSNRFYHSGLYQQLFMPLLSKHKW